ncbi:MAG: type VI secretion system baseplate subunit TssF [Pseudomonadota bacterium]
MKAPKKTRLANYFQEELDAMRAEASTFAGQHPGMAGGLGLGAGRSSDPHVDLLQQSFAFMGARLRHHVDQDKARIPNALAESLYPHLGQPSPSMLIAQADQVTCKAPLPRHQALGTRARNEAGLPVECRFRLAYATTLIPLEVQAAALHPPAAGMPGPGALAITLRRSAGAGSEQLSNETLRFFIDAEAGADAWRLYELLALHHGSIRTSLGEAAGATLRWLGFDDDEAMLHAHPQTPSAYRVLQEYFAFPQKFMFFEIGPLALTQMGQTLELRIDLDAPLNHLEQLAPSVLRLNCLPLVNLFKRNLEPLALEHTEYEYRLTVDLSQHRHYEVVAVDTLYSVRADGSTREIVPYFGFDEIDGTRKPDYFYLGRRERSEASNVAGGEFYVSFLDQHFALTKPMDEVVGGTALCSNRRLPEQLRIGTRLHLEGAGPAVQLTTIGKPTAHDMPPLIGARPWALVSQLALNRLSLAEGPQALDAFKKILRLHAGQDRIVGLRQIEGIVGLAARRLMRMRQVRGWQGFVRALRIDIKLDRNSFRDASPVLFWTVLRQFFALYATVNTVLESGFVTTDCSGDDAAWPLLEGRQCEL